MMAVTTAGNDPSVWVWMKKENDPMKNEMLKVSWTIRTTGTRRAHKAIGVPCSIDRRPPTAGHRVQLSVPGSTQTTMSEHRVKGDDG